MSRWHTSDFECLPVQAFRPRGWRAGMTMEGGKGSSTPAPDPRLIEAQIKSLGVQDAAVADILDLSKRMQPLQEEQLRFGLDSARRATEEAAQDREYSLGRRAALTGVQDTIIQDARSFNEEGTARRLQGEAITDVTNAFAAQRENEARRMARMGIDPSSAKGRSASTMMSIQEALAKGSAATVARDQARQEGRAVTDRAANVLAGYPSMSMDATGAGARYGTAGVGVVNQGVAGILSGPQSVAEGAGSVGRNAASMWGAQSNAYQQSQAQENQGAGALLGAGTTIAAAFI